MKYSAAFLALATTVLATPVPQGVTDSITPPTSAPPGCSGDVSGTFNIQIVNVSSTPAKVKVSFMLCRGLKDSALIFHSVKLLALSP
jgi:hypothetical protein